MESFFVLLGLLLALGVVVFAVGGWILGWVSFFQVKSLREEVEVLKRAKAVFSQPSAEVPRPMAAPRSPDPAPAEAPPSRTQPVPVVAPPRVSGWEKKLLENWTGLAGLAIITLGLGFLAVYGAAVLNPFGRFLLIVALAVVCAATGLALVRTRPRWTRWGYWLQSFGAAVFLIACLGSGGIPGVAWVGNPWAALGLLMLGVGVNFTLGSYRRRQPYLTLHVTLSLLALAVPEPSPLILVFLTATALGGLGLSWFQKWAYNRALTAVVFQGISAVSFLRLDAPDQSTQLFYLAASATVALLIHLASYRRHEKGIPWSRAAFLTHLLNAAGAGLACGLWAPRHPWLAAAVLVLLAAATAVLARRARQSGTSWLYRTDRLLALVIAAVVLLLNPLGALPVVLGSAFLLLLLVFAWTAKVEGDEPLFLVGRVLIAVGLGTLTLASLVALQGGPGLWAWQVGACFAAGLATLTFLAFQPSGELEQDRWHGVSLAILPALFVVPLAALWTGWPPVEGLSPGWVLLPPWAALAWLARTKKSAVLAASLTVFSGLVVLIGWISWLWLQGYWTGDPVGALVWGAPAWAMALVPLTLYPRTSKGFRTAWTGAVAATAHLTAFTLAGVHPVLPSAALAGLGFLALALGNRLKFWGTGQAFTAALLVGGLAASRIVLVFFQSGVPPIDPAVLVCDAAGVALLVALAWNKATGPGLFWEGALVGTLWTFWVDLPRDSLPLLVAVLATGLLAAGRFSIRARRLDGYSVVLFLGANLLTLPAQDLVFRGLALGTLMVYLVLDSLTPGTQGTRPRWEAVWAPYRRSVVVLVQAAVLAFALPAFLDPRTLTFGWSLEAALLFLLAVLWKDALFKNASFVALAACLVRLLWVDLSNSDLLTKALTFLSVGGLMVGMNVLYLWSKNRRA